MTYNNEGEPDMPDLIVDDPVHLESDELAGSKIGAGALSALTSLFAMYGIYTLLIDDVGIVASAVWFYGLPVALIMAAIALLCLRRVRGATPERTGSASALYGVVVVSCGLLAVLFGMGLTYFW